VALSLLLSLVLVVVLIFGGGVVIIISAATVGGAGIINSCDDSAIRWHQCLLALASLLLAWALALLSALALSLYCYR